MKVVLKRTPFVPRDPTDPWQDLEVVWTLEIPDEEKEAKDEDLEI